MGISFSNSDIRITDFNIKAIDQFQRLIRSQSTDEFDKVFPQVETGAVISFWDNMISLAALYGEKADLIEYLFEKNLCYMSGADDKTPLEIAYDKNDAKTFELLADLAS